MRYADFGNWCKTAEGKNWILTRQYVRALCDMRNISNEVKTIGAFIVDKQNRTNTYYGNASTMNSNIFKQKIKCRKEIVKLYKKLPNRAL